MNVINELGFFSLSNFRFNKYFRKHAYYIWYMRINYYAVYRILFPNSRLLYTAFKIKRTTIRTLIIYTRAPWKLHKHFVFATTMDVVLFSSPRIIAPSSSWSHSFLASLDEVGGEGLFVWQVPCLRRPSPDMLR